MEGTVERGKLPLLPSGILMRDSLPSHTVWLLSTTTGRCAVVLHYTWVGDAWLLSDWA